MATPSKKFKSCRNHLAITILIFAVCTMQMHAKSDSIQQKKYQAKPPKTQAFGEEAFEKSNNTTLRWMGMGGFFINSRGATMMIDPLLKDFDMPIMIDFPIKAEDVPRLDAVLITHADNDHYSVPTTNDLAGVTTAYHSTQFVASLLKNEGGFPAMVMV